MYVYIYIHIHVGIYISIALFMDLPTVVFVSLFIFSDLRMYFYLYPYEYCFLKLYVYLPLQYMYIFIYICVLHLYLHAPVCLEFCLYVHVLIFARLFRAHFLGSWALGLRMLYQASRSFHRRHRSYLPPGLDQEPSALQVAVWPRVPIGPF